MNFKNVVNINSKKVICFVTLFLLIGITISVGNGEVSGSGIGKSGFEFQEINTSSRSSCYDVATYLSQTMQETPPSVLGYFELIDCLENPDYSKDLENKARSAVESMDNILQEIPVQFIDTLFYTCTVKKIDTLLTALIRNGLFYATRELIIRKIYGIQHLLHARDSNKDNVLHLAVRAESTNIIDLMWKHMNTQIRLLLEEKNYDSQRPVDLSEEMRCSTCTIRLKEIYRITSQAHLPELPPPPPIPHIPELEILKRKEDKNRASKKAVSEHKKEQINKEEYNGEEGSEEKSTGKRSRKLKSKGVNGYEPLYSEHDYSKLHNKGYIDVNGMVSSDQKKGILDKNMIMTIVCFVSFILLLISCFCLVKK
ncbi:putative transmembrane protein [Cryptosporidium ryanae]|uniref:putative transmembrane protein n=1 Tax=Cryptosporidium ryanae TaxID=515981 RepID=UPI00351A82AA|nr:putative transmembrane protein [Cryptosporidium ryanae]